MRAVHDPAVRLRKAILEITRELRKALHHGGTLPVAEIHDAIETLIEEAINASVQDAIFNDATE